MEKILIFDGNAFLHRAFHAIPFGLQTKNGIHTNALYGFFLMALNIIREIDPSYCIFAFDSKKKTFRHEVFVEYKANRAKAPDELYAQLPFIKEGLDIAFIKHIDFEGYEADDIIGSLSKKYANEDTKVIIATGDMDTLQLIDKNILVASPSKGIKNLKFYTEEEVEKKYGIKPRQVIDFKAICGDKSDNIPGIRGLGPVAATKILNIYGTLENIYANIEKINPSTLKEKFINDKEIAFLSQKLARINIELNLNIDLKSTHLSNINLNGLYDFFKKYECYNLINKANFLEKKVLFINNNQPTLF